jgi:hypothetical protein
VRSHVQTPSIWRAAAFAAALAATTVLLAPAPVAFAGKAPDRTLAGTGAFGSAESEIGAGSTLDSAVNLASVADGSTDPTGDSTDGYVYIADDANQRIQIFDSAGNFKFMWGRGVQSGGLAAEVCDRTETPCTVGSTPNGGEGGMLGEPRAIAIDQQTGHVFVGEGAGSGAIANSRISEFEADGDFVRAWGWDVVAGNAETGFETCLLASQCKQGVSGSGLGQLRGGGTGRLGLDVQPSTGDLFVADTQNNRVQRFEVPASPTDPVAAPPSADVFAPFPGVSELAVDDGVVYGGRNLGGGSVVTRYDLAASTFLVPLDVGSLTATSKDNGANVMGLEIDRSSGNLLVARDRFLGFVDPLQQALGNTVVHLDGRAGATGNHIASQTGAVREAAGRGLGDKERAT